MTRGNPESALGGRCLLHTPVPLTHAEAAPADVMPGADLEMAALATELKNEEPMDQGESGGSEFNNGFGENEESGGDMGGVKDDEVY